MSSLTQNISQAIADFRAIKAAITDSGVTVPSGTPTADYPDYIAQISGSSAPIYGVSGLYQSEPVLTRTDDAVTKSFVINSSSGLVNSDFDSVFPWNETEIVNDTAGKFLKFPKMYFRVGCDSSNRLTDVAVSKAPRETGNWYEVAPFMVACYKGTISNNKLVSESGNSIASLRCTRAQYRTYAAANGSGYHIMDLYHRTVLLFLWFIEFATKKYNTVMTGRVKEGNGEHGRSTDRRDTGGTDNLTSPSGYETEYGQMRYHFIEDFVGNSFDIVDGIYCSWSGSPHYVTTNPAKFSESYVGKNQLGYNAVSTGGWIKALGWDSNNPFMCMPVEVGGSDDTYFCDYIYGVENGHMVLGCGVQSADSGSDCGLTCFGQLAESYSSETKGTRIIKELS